MNGINTLSAEGFAKIVDANFFDMLNSDIKLDSILLVLTC